MALADAAKSEQRVDGTKAVGKGHVKHSGKICNASSRLMLRLADGLGRWADRGGCEGIMHINVCNMIEVDDVASS